jgi:hypothetical protein
MRKSALWLVASLSIATTACVRTHTNEASGKVDVDIESPTKKGENWKGELKGQGMYASVRGTTRAQYLEGRTSVTVALENATPGATFTWDLREGKCGANGPVVGDRSAYTNLTVESNGKAGTTITLLAPMDEAKNYAITVYGPGEQTIVACGDIDD